MNSCRTVCSRHKYGALGLLLGLLLLNGCVTPPLFYKQTIASGFVVNDSGDPMEDIDVEVRWVPKRLNFWFAPHYSRRIKTGPNGEWSFRVRKVEVLYVEAIHPACYELINREDRLFGPLRYGESNAVPHVFRLRKKEGQ